MLGEALCEQLEGEHRVTAWGRKEIDVSNRRDCLEKITELKPEIILNAAAFVDVDGCEREPDLAWKANALGSQNLALAAARNACAYLYVSSDYLFDGRSDSDYDEFCPPSPVNQYGRCKLAGEVLARRVCGQTYIVRTAWLFGHRPNNYVERVLSQAAASGRVRMASDQVESPTYTRHLARAVACLIDSGAYGTYHVTSRGACTRTEFARFVLDEAGKTAEVVEIPPEEVKRLAARPQRTVLDCRLYRLVTNQELPDWQEGVRAYLRNSGQADGLTRLS